MFISLAHADTGAQAAAPGGAIQTVIMLAVFALIFYFMIFRPQNKRMKEHRNLMASMHKGDEVMTTSGFIGKIVKISDESPYIVIALNSNNEVMIKRDFVSAVLPKGTIQSL